MVVPAASTRDSRFSPCVGHQSMYSGYDQGVEVCVPYCGRFHRTPHFACSSTSSLHLVHHEGDVMLFTDVRDSLKEGWRPVIVSSFCLDRLRDDTSYWRSVTCSFGYKFFYLCQTSPVFSLILCLIVLQWILVLGEVCLWPV